MKKLILFFGMLFFMIKITAQDVQKLYDNRDFIQLSNLNFDDLENDDFSVPFMKANVYNAMARCDESNKEIEYLLLKNDVKENSYLMLELLHLQADN
jgi:hypothetical protein